MIGRQQCEFPSLLCSRSQDVDPASRRRHVAVNTGRAICILVGAAGHRRHSRAWRHRAARRPSGLAQRQEARRLSYEKLALLRRPSGRWVLRGLRPEFQKTRNTVGGSASTSPGPSGQFFFLLFFSFPPRPRRRVTLSVALQSGRGGLVTPILGGPQAGQGRGGAQPAVVTSSPTARSAGTAFQAGGWPSPAKPTRAALKVAVGRLPSGAVRGGAGRATTTMMECRSDA